MKREGCSIMEVGYLGRLELRMREWWKRKAHTYRSASKVNFIFVFMNPSVIFFQRLLISVWVRFGIRFASSRVL
jgi:hypothetical protein